MAKETYQFFKLIEKNSAREVYGKKLAEVGKVNPKIVVLTADHATTRPGLPEGVPERFFNTGIADRT
jgi:transketolase C-terminal domain/subunit